MNKVNWVDGRYTTPADFNAMQSAPEDHLASQAKPLAGMVDGMALTGTTNGVQVAPGVTWDNQGRRIMVPSAASVDVSAILRPASGRYKWVSIFAAYRRVERGTVRDSGGVDQPAYFDDGYTLTAAAGPEFTSAVDLLDSPRVVEQTESGHPATPPGAVKIGFFAIDHDSGWEDMVANRQQFIAPFQRVAMILSRPGIDIGAEIRKLVPAGQAAYAWGGLSTGAPFNISLAPVLFVQNQPTPIIGCSVPASVGVTRVPSDTSGLRVQIAIFRP